MVEQVLTEGTPEDVRFYIRAPDLVDPWDELVLPRHVRDEWNTGVQRRATTPRE